MSKYYAMSPDDALRYLTERDDGLEPVLPDFCRLAGMGDEMDRRPFTVLRNELLKLKRKFPAKLRDRDQEGGKFEQQACVVVHKCFAKVDKSTLADLDFWTWVAVAHLADIVEWRFGAAGGRARPENYGIGRRTENLFFRLWLRADVALDAKARDPYHLAIIGDQDLWRSHILRVRYADAREIARGLIRLQDGQLGKKRLSRESIRELAKRLRRLGANVMFEYLNGKQAEGLLLELSVDLGKGK